MKKTVIGIALLSLASFLFAQQQSITSLQEEILSLAKQRHEIMGKNLELREQMLAVHKEQKAAQGASVDQSREKMRPLWTSLRQNQQQVRTISRSIQEKRKMLANLIKTKKMHGKEKKAEVLEDISNVD